MVTKEEYKKALADHICVSVEDLTPNELALIDKGYLILQNSLTDMKVMEDDVKRLNLELANYKAMYNEDTRASDYDDEFDEDMD